MFRSGVRVAIAKFQCRDVIKRGRYMYRKTLQARRELHLHRDHVTVNSSSIVLMKALLAAQGYHSTALFVSQDQPETHAHPWASIPVPIRTNKNTPTEKKKEKQKYERSN